jgi:peptidoglycan/xylan/chitin deacetylase (PgdA/CDA1 family)
MSVAEHVMDTLKKHHIKASFFLANEKTYRGDYALDDSWKSFWNHAAAQGHVFGSHTMNHSYFQKDDEKGRVLLKAQFGPNAGRIISADTMTVCNEIAAVDQRFIELTGVHLKKIWRAPGGKTSSRLIEMANTCGFKHTAWSDTGFLGDELSSEKFPNAQLLKKSLNEIKDGDITMAHLGIWSRKDPWAIAVLEPLIEGLEAKGFCFKTIGQP